MKRRWIWIGSVLVMLALAVVGDSWRIRHTADLALRHQIQAAHADALQIATENAQNKPLEATVKSGTTFSEMLAAMDFDPATVYATTEAARKVFNLRQLRPGRKLLVRRSPQGELRALDYHIDPEHELWVLKDGTDFDAEIKQTPAAIQIVPISGEVQGSLFDGIMAAGETPELAVRLADIFAWDIDFNTDTQPGDTFRLVVEKKEFADGSSPSYGRIFAAEYTNSGHVYRAVLFHDASGNSAYYSATGQSLQKLFLRSPLPFAARISSHFSLHRFHPILKIYRPHLGTDYAAPVGTPVQSIADGHVVFAGRKGQDGNLVKIAHSRGYETYYMHLSRVLVHPGQHVRQGQHIGLVGQTGLATGPHLDFRLQQNGRFVDFEHLHLPPAQPVAKADREEFAQVRDHWMEMLPAAGAPKTAVASTGSPAALPANQGGQP